MASWADVSPSCRPWGNEHAEHLLPLGAEVVGSQLAVCPRPAGEGGHIVLAWPGVKTLLEPKSCP